MSTTPAMVNPDLALTRRPEEVIAEARRAARALMEVVNQKADPVIFNGERYLDFQDYQTLGRMFGVTAKIVSTEAVEYAGARGFLARAVALRHDGAEISAAEAICLNDEETWSVRAKYDWHYVTKSGKLSAEDPGKDEIIWEDNPDKPGKKRPKKQRIKVGDVPVPAFQLRSMAQTRAAAKALRMVLGYVPVMAGIRATPAEEMTGDEQPDGAPKKPPVKMPTRKGEAPPQANAAPAAPGAPAGDAPKPPPAAQVGNEIVGVVEEIQSKSGKKANGDPWTRWGIRIGSDWYATFERGVRDTAEILCETKEPARVTFVLKGDYRNILAIGAASDPREPGADDLELEP